MVNIYCYDLLVSKRKREEPFTAGFRSAFAQLLHTIYFLNQSLLLQRCSSMSINQLLELTTRPCTLYMCGVNSTSGLFVPQESRTTENHFLTHNSKENAAGRSMMCAEVNRASGHRGQGSHTEHITFFFVCMVSVKKVLAGDAAVH